MLKLPRTWYGPKGRKIHTDIETSLEHCGWIAYWADNHDNQMNGRCEEEALDKLCASLKQKTEITQPNGDSACVKQE